MAMRYTLECCKAKGLESTSEMFGVLTGDGKGGSSSSDGEGLRRVDAIV